LPSSPRVADVAAGRGTISLQVAAAGGRVSAIDLSDAMEAIIDLRGLAIVENAGPSLRNLLESLAFPDGRDRAQRGRVAAQNQ
jgi:hypothetical protein